MNAAAIFNAAIAIWRPVAEQRHSLLFVEAFLNKHRERLIRVIDQELTARRIRRGGAPRSAPEYMEVYAAVDRERKTLRLRGADDPTIITRLLKRLDLPDTAPPEQQERAARLVRTYIDLRAEAILLQAAGWDAEALPLRRPSLVILRDDAHTAIGPLGVRYIARAMRDAAGVLHLNPAYNDKDLQELRTAADAAHQQVAQLRERITDGAKVGRYALALWTHARALIAAPTAPEPMLVREIESPPDHKTPAWRTKANLQAMNLVLAKEPDEMTSEDLQAVAGYSGWGGLSIEKVKAQIPTELVPETFGLIHEYYTPTVIAESLAEVLCPYLPELTGEDGLVRALEPSAGIGRLIRAFSPRRCLALEAGGQIKGIQWTAVEFSKSRRPCCARSGPTSLSTTCPSSAGCVSTAPTTKAPSTSSSRTHPTASAAPWPAKTPTSFIRKSAPSPTSCAAASICSSPAGSASI
jgi:hypothetical protein